MTTAIFSPAPAASPLRQYLSDVSYAARAFAEALFAAQGRQFVAQEVRAAEASDGPRQSQGPAPAFCAGQPVRPPVAKPVGRTARHRREGLSMEILEYVPVALAAVAVVTRLIMFRPRPRSAKNKAA